MKRFTYETMWLRITLLGTLVIAALAAPPTGELCNKCTCKNVAIICKCTDTFKDVIVQHGSLADTSELEKVEVRDCKSLTLPQGAFKHVHNLKTFFVSKVQNVSFDVGVFETLDTLMIESVNSLILKQSAFQGVKGLSSIVIKKSIIPEITKWALFDIKELRELRIEDSEVQKIEREGIFIDMNHSHSNVIIIQTTFGKIEENGLRIGNATNVNIARSQIKNADTKSIRLSSRLNMTINDNIFQQDVDVDSALVFYNGSLSLINNHFYNIGANYTESDTMPQTADTFFQLLSQHNGNKIICECANNITNITGAFFQNVCINGCQEATVGSFLQSCQENKNLSNEERMQKICKGKIIHDIIPSSSPIVKTTTKPIINGKKNSGMKINATLVPLFVALFFQIFTVLKHV